MTNESPPNTTNTRQIQIPTHNGQPGLQMQSSNPSGHTNPQTGKCPTQQRARPEPTSCTPPFHCSLRPKPHFCWHSNSIFSNSPYYSLQRITGSHTPLKKVGPFTLCYLYFLSRCSHSCWNSSATFLQSSCVLRNFKYTCWKAVQIALLLLCTQCFSLFKSFNDLDCWESPVAWNLIGTTILA
jgi:hypothetical protein